MPEVWRQQTINSFTFHSRDQGATPGETANLIHIFDFAAKEKQKPVPAQIARRKSNHSGGKGCGIT